LLNAPKDVISGRFFLSQTTVFFLPGKEEQNLLKSYTETTILPFKCTFGNLFAEIFVIAISIISYINIILIKTCSVGTYESR